MSDKKKDSEGSAAGGDFAQNSGSPSDEFTRTGSGERTQIMNVRDGSVTKAGGRLSPIVQIAAGSEQGRILQIPFEGRFVVGRGRDCDLVLLDPSCSRQHAEFYVAPDDSTYVKDLGSTNGTRINGKRITGSAALADGDRVQLGDNSVLKFQLVPENEAQVQIDVYHRATRDPLTNAFNRRQFDELFQRELSFQRRGTQGLGLLMLDIDFFKKINDSFGHLAGDEVLREMARRVRSCIRNEDVFSRLGGEEFAVLVRSDNPEGVTALGERIRLSLESQPATFEGRAIPFTASVGCTFLEPKAVTTSDVLLQSADEALYEAKHAGRNRVVFRAQPKA
jgi:diguanylate cyclase (GGDEF)-like protein